MQKTFKGKTAGGILKTAHIQQMQAGTWEVVVTWPHRCLAMLGQRQNGWGETVEDVLVLSDFDGLLVRLSMSPSALKKLKALEWAREQKYDD